MKFRNLIFSALAAISLAACGKEEDPASKAENKDVNLTAPVIQVEATTTSLTVTWGAVEGARQYQVDYCLASDAEFSMAGRTTELSYRITGLEPETQYKVRVQAIASSKNRSEWSEIANVATESSGTISYPLTINDAALLVSWLDVYAADCAATDVVTLGADLDLTGLTVTPAASFAGVFNGNGKALKNYSATGPLFTTLEGTVKDLIVDASCKLEAGEGNDIAFVAGHVLAGGVVSGCVNNAPITRTEAFTATARLGAIVGRLQGTISGCTNKGDITLSMTSAADEHVIGGVVGYCDAAPAVDADLILDCHNTGKIVLAYTGTPAKTFLGGVLGTSTVTKFDGDVANIGNIRGCSNTGSVSFSIGTNDSGTYGNVGGVAGYFQGRVLSCTNEGAVSYTVDKSETGCTRPAVGGVVAYAAFSVKDCINRGSVTLAGTFANGTSNERGAGKINEIVFGGVAGAVSGKDYSEEEVLSGCSNYGELRTDLDMNPENGSSANLGGVVGWCNVPVIDCKNDDNSTPVLFKSRVRWFRAGGVIGWQNNGSVSGCSNAKEVTFDANCLVQETNCSQQLRCGGIIGHYNAGNTTVSNCSNSGALTMQNGWHAEKNASYLGGVFGSGNETYGHTVTGCSNTGKITSTTESYVFIGGVCGGLYGSLTGCTNDGEVVVSNAKAKVVGTVNYFSEIGGLIGFVLANLDDNASNGNISITTSDSGVRVGGLCGAINGKYAKTWKGDTLNCTISCDGECTAGAFLGAFRSNGGVTLGAEDKHETVTSASKVLGAAVEKGVNLVGNMGSGAAFSYEFVDIN